MIGKPRAVFLFWERIERAINSVKQEQRGIIGIGAIIAAVLALFGIGLLSTIDLTFLFGILVMVVIILAMVGCVFFKLPFSYVMITAIICLAIVVFMEVGATAAAGLIIIGGVFWKFGAPGKHLWVFIFLIGIGLIAVIWGTEFLIQELGIFP